MPREFAILEIDKKGCRKQLLFKPGTVNLKVWKTRDKASKWGNKNLEYFQIITLLIDN